MNKINPVDALIVCISNLKDALEVFKELGYQDVLEAVNENYEGDLDIESYKDIVIDDLKAIINDFESYYEDNLSVSE